MEYFEYTFVWHHDNLKFADTCLRTNMSSPEIFYCAGRRNSS